MKKIRLKFFFIAAGSVLAVLLFIITGLNVTNALNMENRSKHDVSFVLETIQPPEGGALPPLPEDPEMSFRNRYFIAYFENGSLSSIDMTHVAKVTYEEATILVNKVNSKKKNHGYINNFFYQKNIDDVNYSYIFLDRQNEIESFSRVLQNSIAVSAVGYFVVLIMVYIFSLIVIKPIEEANRKQKQFITDASHELKTPLTIISSNTEIIEMEHGEDEWTASTKKQIDKLVKMTNDLVNLSKLNEDKIVIEKAKINLGDVLNDIVYPYEQLLNKKNISLECKINNNCVLLGDPKLISNLFSTLMDNMSKYSLEGTAHVSLYKYKNNIIVKFINPCDSSLKNEVGLLFDRFYKGDKSRNSSSDGFGVGLAMAKRIVEIHKGRICASYNDSNLEIKISF